MSDLLTLGETAARLSCSVKTVRRRIHAGDLPSFRDGGLVRVREADLRRYVLERVACRVSSDRGTVQLGRALPPKARLWD